MNETSQVSEGPCYNEKGKTAFVVIVCSQVGEWELMPLRLYGIQYLPQKSQV